MLLKKIPSLKLILFIFYCMPIVSQSAEISDDFWLLEDYQPLGNTLWVYAGKDEDNGDYYGLNTILSVSETIRFELNATQQNYILETRDYNIGLSGYVAEQFSWGIYKLFWGNKNTLEKNDTALSVGYFSGRFNSQLSIEKGEIELFLKQSNELPFNSLTRDHSAVELSLGYSWTQFYAGLRHKQHDYKKTSPTLFRRLRNLNLLSGIGLQQARNLADRELSILLGYQFESFSCDLQLSQIDSAFSRSRYQYASFNVIKNINLQWQLGATLDLPIDNGLLSAGLSLGYMW